MVKRLVTFVVTCIALGCAGASTSTPHSMKGWELYSWSDACTNEDASCFALLVGTNRQKSLAEIRQAPLTLGELEAKLATLNKSDELFWSAPAPEFTLPDAKRPARDPVQRAEATIRRLGLKLTVER